MSPRNLQLEEALEWREKGLEWNECAAKVGWCYQTLLRKRREAGLGRDGRRAGHNASNNFGQSQFFSTVSDVSKAAERFDAVVAAGTEVRLLAALRPRRPSRSRSTLLDGPALSTAVHDPPLLFGEVGETGEGPERPSNREPSEWPWAFSGAEGDLEEHRNSLQQYNAQVKNKVQAVAPEGGIWLDTESKSVKIRRAGEWVTLWREGYPEVLAKICGLVEMLENTAEWENVVYPGKSLRGAIVADLALASRALAVTYKLMEEELARSLLRAFSAAELAKLLDKKESGQ
jgi:hypothetical protein